MGGRFGYLSTTAPVLQEVTAHVGGSAEASDPIALSAQALAPVVAPSSQAAAGFFVTGCADYAGSAACRLAAPTAAKPALFMTQDSGGHPAAGLMLQTVAQTALASLPLQQVANQPEHNVAATTLSINTGEVSMDTTAGFQPADRVDTYLVTHGSAFSAHGIEVGGGN